MILGFVDLADRDATFSGHVIKKNKIRGAKHGPSQRQKMYYQAKQILKRPVRESTDAIQRYFHDGTPERRPHIIVRQDSPGEAHPHR